MKLEDIFGVAPKEITAKDINKAIDEVLPKNMVYRLTNHTRKQVYHGVTENLERRLKEPDCLTKLFVIYVIFIKHQILGN